VRRAMTEDAPLVSAALPRPKPDAMVGVRPERGRP
jgi:hypothetical protein